MPSDPRVSLKINLNKEPGVCLWLICPWCYWPVEAERQGLMALHFTAEHPDKNYELAVFPTTYDPGEYLLKTKCPACLQWLSTHGLQVLPNHYRDDPVVMVWCEGSSQTPDFIREVLADRAERDRPGLYVRPHP